MITGLRALTAALATIVALSPAAAVPPGSPLKGLEPGEWELRERVSHGEKGEVRRVCLAELRQLIQLRHGRSQCKRLTVDEGVKHLAVSYDCGPAGNGRTDLRFETPRLVQVRTQGIADGAPFSLTLEGRKVGDCR